MATLTQAHAALLTYEAYMAEPEVQGRYDIVNGVRYAMAGASWRHQRIAKNLSKALGQYEEVSGTGLLVFAPYDILIRRYPKLGTRQPDMLFVSHARLRQGGGIPEIGPLEIAPELVIEIISDSETQRILSDKIADYIAIGVDECWVVRPEARTVEVLRLTPGGPQTIAVYDEQQILNSVAFPNLTLPVAEIFAP